MELTPTQALDKYIKLFYPFTADMNNWTTRKDFDTKFTQWLRDNNITLKE